MNMKFFVILIGLMFSVELCMANVLPQSISDIPGGTLGLYQTDKHVKVYEKPDASSKILVDNVIIYDNYKNVKKDDFFAIVVPAKELSYLYVTDVYDDENWVEVIIDKASNKRGWVYKNDNFQFLPWGNFITLYGRKYGLFRLNTGFIDVDNGIYSAPDDSAQQLDNIAHPKYIRLTSMEGSWVLVTLLDYNGDSKTGYIKWYTNSGNILLFPDIK